MKIVNALRSRRVRICSVQGKRGVGKSCVVSYVARRMTDQSLYIHGVHYFDVGSYVGSGKPRWAEEPEAASARVESGGLPQLWQDMKALIKLQNEDAADAHTNADPKMLIVIDGCDLISPQQSLRDFAQSVLKMYPGVQFMLSGNNINIGSSSPTLTEEVVQVPPLSGNESAQLMIQLVRSCVDRERFHTGTSSFLLMPGNLN